MLYNKEINKIKATELNGIATGTVPIEFKVEQDAFADDGNYEIKYKTTVNKVDIDTNYTVRKLKKRSDNAQFLEKLKDSKRSRR